MKKRVALALAALLCFALLAGCAQQPAAPVRPDPAPEAPDVPDKPDVSAPVDWYADYAAFVDDHYDALLAACGQISGFAFLDLDRDGTPELLVYDGGASAAMGVNLFDLDDGGLVCVSCCFDESLLSKLPVRAGEQVGKVFINANGESSFRLLETPADGTQFYIVESGNGAALFLWRELIRFGCDESGLVTLESLMYRRDLYDEATMEPAGSECTVGGEPADADAYDKACAAFFAGVQETGFSIPDVFLWTGDYTQTHDGCMAMLRDAADTYRDAAA